MSTDIENKIKEYEEYIKTHELTNFTIYTHPTSKHVWLIKTLKNPVKVKYIIECTDFLSDSRFHCEITHCGVRIDIKGLSVIICTKDDVLHQNQQGEVFRIEKEVFRAACVGSLFNEFIDFDNIAQVFSVPDRAIATLSREATIDLEEYDEENDENNFIDVEHDINTTKLNLWNSYAK